MPTSYLPVPGPVWPECLAAWIATRAGLPAGGLWESGLASEIRGELVNRSRAEVRSYFLARFACKPEETTP